MSPAAPIPSRSSSAPRLLELTTRERWIEVARIVVTAVVMLRYSQGLLPLPVLPAALAFGLYPPVRIGLFDLIHERKIGTEIFVTVATSVAVLGGEYTAGAVLLVMILIADLNTDRARASIKALIGCVPQTALVGRAAKALTLPVAELRVGEVVIARASERIPLDGIVKNGQASVNQAPITGESLRVEKTVDSSVFAGTILELGVLDIETQKLGRDTTYSSIVALVEGAKASMRKLADRVAGILIPVAVLLIVFVMTRASAGRAHRTMRENLCVGVGAVHVLGITVAVIHWGFDDLMFLDSMKLLSVQLIPNTAPKSTQRRT